ncbi:hypothetical protein AVEN_131701-1 [Araneus ventricosus]|uniref:Uncharacterized protein n=1 Tax=Araneus ventricosus TaxID=182803 RepID=A0A4Y2RUL5_ARAVE|nr:hypothetical protein AVEN_91563-1 [Araneus ventricosus]GBN79478.1 hypothetical protein AVEN_131701-1 [Araneus ventricosus]
MQRTNSSVINDGCPLRSSSWTFYLPSLNILTHFHTVPLLIAFSPCWKLSANASFGIARSTVVTRCWICAMSEKRRLFRTPLSRGNKKKSAGARSGEYGGCSRTVTLRVARNCFTRMAVCGRALSWSSFH